MGLVFGTKLNELVCMPGYLKGFAEAGLNTEAFIDALLKPPGCD